MQGDPRVGTELAGYRIEAVVGRGGMAVVYLAHRLSLGRKVALKILDPALAEDEAFRERFIRESRIAAGLEHPNIVTVYDAGEADGLLYVSMRYVEGTDLERLLEARGRVSPSVALSIVSQSAAALDAAHAEGLVHRGLRPADILLESGKSGRAFLSDLGITKHVAATTRLTRTGSFAGTVDYVAPEVIRGDTDVDGRADVYSLGCVLYRCLVGDAPFPRESELVTIFAHLNDPPPRATERLPELPAEIDDVIGRALAKSREDRFQTCGALAEAAATALGPSATPIGEEATTPAPRGPRSLRPAVVAGAIILLLAGAAVAFSIGSRAGPPTPSPPTPLPVPSSGPVVIAAAGEIACSQLPYLPADTDHCQYDNTARLLHPNELSAVLALGDNQYYSGSFNEYLAYYDTTWGQVARAITEPVPGDHEYNENPDSNAPGYRKYWGTGKAGAEGLGYRSLDLPSGCTPGEGVCWHVVALNSELCLRAGGCGPAVPGTTAGAGNDMYRWLKQDLAAHPNSAYGCTLAYWHHPLYAFSSVHATTPEVQPLWNLLYAAGADVVLNAHAGNYERWAPQDTAGHHDPARGIREFVVGTGGVKKEPLQAGPWPATLAAAQDKTFGVLEIELLGSGFTWRWVSASGQPPFADARSKPVACH